MPVEIASVTGADGSLGSATVQRFTDEGIHVIAGIRNPDQKDLPQFDELREQGLVEILDLDLTDGDSIRNVIYGADVVVHTPAAFYQGPPKGSAYDHAYNVNVTAFQTVLDAARDVNKDIRVAVINTVGQYGAEEGKVTEETPLSGKTTYAVTKTKVEEIVKVSDVDYTTFRFGSIYGPGARIWSLFVYDLVSKVDGNFPFFVGKGDGLTPIVDIRDAADAIYRASQDKESSTETYNVVADNVTQDEIAQYYAVLLGKKPRFLPRGVALALGKIMDAYTNALSKPFPFIEEQIAEENIRRVTDARTVVSSEKIVEKLGMQFRPAEETLGDSIIYANEVYDLQKGKEIELFLNRKRQSQATA